MSYVQPCSRTRYDENCNLIRVRFTEEGKKDRRWILGLTWGLYLYQYPLFGTAIQIKLKVSPHVQPVGPNQVLKKLRKKRDESIPEGIDSLWKLLTAAYEALNRSDPEATRACWLCYDINPPFYEAVGLAAPFSQSDEDSPAACKWNRKGPSLTLQAVTGSGTCIGKVPSSHIQLCAQTSRPIGESKWMIPAPDSWWICSKTGLTPCVSRDVFNLSPEYCIMILIFPRVLYHRENVIYDLWTEGTEARESIRTKRERFTAITLATLFGLGAIGAGTGISSLAIQHRGFNSLRTAIDEDIARLEDSISHLEKSLTSFSEVVLQNRRGLDLVFLQQ
uniref:Envelope glycoprotein n=1 Tax=Panthera leo TaxID=9689 RepID=A0A8C9DBB9_PANLE